MSDDDQEVRECEGGLPFATDASWERVGREAVAGELSESRYAVDEEFRTLEAALRAGEEIDARQVRDARVALNRAHNILEMYVATTTEGTRAWGHPAPDIPVGRLRELAHVDDREAGQEETDE